MQTTIVVTQKERKKKMNPTIKFIELFVLLLITIVCYFLERRDNIKKEQILEQLAFELSMYKLKEAIDAMDDDTGALPLVNFINQMGNDEE